MSNLKVEGKVADFCPKCKNCKGITRESNGVHVWLTEVECEDPYDGMKKTLNADSDICCSMFEPKPDRRCEKCERFDGTYCHGPNGTITISYKALFGESVDCPSYSEKKACESEESRIEELIKASKRKDDLIQSYREKLKKANDEINLLNSKFDKLGEYYRTDEKLIDNIQKVIFPQEEGSDYTYSYDEILDKVKELKVRSDEDKTMDKVMYEDLEYWKERCHNAETDVTTLNSKVDVLDKRNTNQFVMIGEKNKEIENLKKAVERRDKWIEDLKSDVDTLQNEILKIRNIAQKAYDDTNRD